MKFHEILKNYLKLNEILKKKKKKKKREFCKKPPFSMREHQLKKHID